ncbi:DDRGK domain-containing protein 1 isoform X2 [Ornithorhynchus anatinus]|uniref:DDRGK domain-containing protein 1 isoform X2 n=1 Tax=Ornithorhynchus anatinus TaxID=9258 RepID=UPI0010A85392|nr:DDRGK domain-containing protein 1 isoform X2 [Ornithorhynchus anatinus]
MEPLLYVLLAAVLAALIAYVSWSRGPEKPAEQEQEHHEAVAAEVAARPRILAAAPAEERGEGMPRRRRNMGNRILAQRRAQQAEEVMEAREEEEEEVAEVAAPGKIGAKKQRKLEEKQARKSQREAEEAEREERKQLEMRRAEERQKEEEQLRLEEERKEEEERKAKEERERQEHEEYLKLKESFVVEEEGEGDAMTEDETRNFLAEFVSYIKEAKIVLLEDLASHMGLRTQDAINRVQDLLANGTLTGVIDDRGKFIYITAEELAAVAQFIRQRGRVSIAELAQASTTLVNLAPEPARPPAPLTPA